MRHFQSVQRVLGWLVMISVMAVSGCGRRGPLVLPEHPPPKVTVDVNAGLE